MRILNSTKQHVCWCGFLAALFALPVVISGTVHASPKDNTHPVTIPPQQVPTTAQSAVTVPPPPVQAKKKPKFMTQVASRLSGIASWYGQALHGHRTASGEIFDESALTACHRTLPFGTMVKVTNMQNHQSVVVRITDRGVLNPERVIDLSSAAAEKIGMLRAGIAPVKLSIVTP